MQRSIALAYGVAGTAVAASVIAVTATTVGFGRGVTPVGGGARAAASTAATAPVALARQTDRGLLVRAEREDARSHDDEHEDHEDHDEHEDDDD